MPEAKGSKVTSPPEGEVSAIKFSNARMKADGPQDARDTSPQRPLQPYLSRVYYDNQSAVAQLRISH